MTDFNKFVLQPVMGYTSYYATLQTINNLFYIIQRLVGIAVVALNIARLGSSKDA